MLIAQMTEDMKQAMKARDKLRLGAIRMLRAAVKDKEIELGREASDTDVLALVDKQIKQRREAAGQYRDAGRADLEAKELAEAEVLSVYLPEPLTAAALDALIQQALSETGAASMRDMGKVMAWLKPQVQGRTDMAKLSATIKAKLG